jgi:hypothetical protein
MMQLCYFFKKRDFVMKNISVLSLLLLFASTQMDAMTANPDLLFGLAYQTIDKLNKDIASGNDDLGALQLLDVMNNCIAFDADQQKALDNAKNTYLYNGVPLDLAKIAADDKKLNADIKNYNKDIDKLSNSSKADVLHTLAVANKNKIKDRKKARDAKQAQLNKNMAAIKANQAGMTTAQSAQAAIKVLRAQNALAFEHALESYISLYGQCYAKSGNMWGSSTIISSKYDQNTAITPREYSQLVTTLQNAVSPFGSTVTIALAIEDSAHVSISDVAGYINNMQPSRSWASFGINVGIGAAIAGTAVVAIVAASNMYQKKSPTDLGDVSNILSNAQATANNLVSNGSANVTSTLQDLQTWWKGLTSSEKATANANMSSSVGNNADAVSQVAQLESALNNGQANSISSTLLNDVATGVGQAAVETIVFPVAMLKAVKDQMENDVSNAQGAAATAGAVAVNTILAPVTILNAAGKVIYNNAPSAYDIGNGVVKTILLPVATAGAVGSAISNNAPSAYDVGNAVVNTIVSPITAAVAVGNNIGSYPDNASQSATNDAYNHLFQ